MHLEIRLLGKFEVRIDKKPVAGFESVKVRALLAYLAAEAGQPQARTKLAGLLWPDYPEKSAQKSLRQALYSLRKTLEELAFLESDRQFITLYAGKDCQIDALHLEQALNEAHSLPKAVSGLSCVDALSLGLFLDGFTLDYCPEFEMWIVNRREHHTRQILDLLSLLADWHAAQNEYHEAEALAHRQIEIEPWRERAYQQLMHILAKQDRRVDALSQYEKLRQALKSELDVEPSEQTNRLFEQIQLGEYVLDASDKKADTASFLQEEPRHNLPLRLTSFIGREKEIGQITNLLKENRLVTLTGPGGVGKTSTALMAATGIIKNYKNGVWFVDFVKLSDESLVHYHAARAIGMQLELGPQTLEKVINFLNPRQILLIMDNCEHLIEGCAAFCEAILYNCPQISILATSREILGIHGEFVYPLPPLTSPAIDEILEEDSELIHYESVKVFIDRAAAVMPGFNLTSYNSTAVTLICNQVDGIPLAIELAAARVNQLPIEQISSRIGNNLGILRGSNRSGTPRHQNLRACIEWSYDLLSDSERKLLMGLSIFMGGWTLEAAEHVCIGEFAPTGNIHEPLSQLALKSLIQIENISGIETRYRMFETIRQFAWEKLDASGLVECLKDNHLHYYQELAQKGGQYMRRAGQVEWLHRFESELPNIREALSWSCDETNLTENRLKRGLKIAGDLHWFWKFRMRMEEGIKWLVRLVNLERDQRGDQPILPEMAFARARALMVLGFSGGMLIKETDVEYLMESQALFRELGQTGRRGLAQTRLILFYGYFHLKDADEQKNILEELYAEFEALHDTHYMGRILFSLGNLSIIKFDYKSATGYFEKMLEIWGQAGEALNLIWIGTACVAYLEGNLEKTKRYINNANQGLNELASDLPNEAHETHKFLGNLYWNMGDYGHAEEHLQKCTVLNKKFGRRTETDIMLGFLALSNGEYTKAKSIIGRFVGEGFLFLMNDFFIPFIGLADVDRLTGEYYEAEKKYQEVLSKTSEIPVKTIALLGLAKNCLQLGDLAAAENFFKQAMELDDYFEYDFLAVLLAKKGKAMEAARLLGASNKTFKRNYFRYPQPDRQMVENAKVKVRRELGEINFTSAWNEGEVMVDRQIQEYSMAILNENKG